MRTSPPCITSEPEIVIGIYEDIPHTQESETIFMQPTLQSGRYGAISVAPVIITQSVAQLTTRFKLACLANTLAMGAGIGCLVGPMTVPSCGLAPAASGVLTYGMMAIGGIFGFGVSAATSMCAGDTARKLALAKKQAART